MSTRTTAVRRDVIVLGGSAGAIDTLRRLLPQLPHDLPAALIVTVHISPAFPSRLAEILSQQSSLPVEPARQGAEIVHGRVYVAVPDMHLAVDSGRLALTRGPREHFTRPAIDVLFRSAARAYGRRVVGVLLCGGGYDGTLGLRDIRAAGGVTLVLDPRFARHPTMPLSAIRSGGADYVVTLEEIAKALPQLSRGESLGDRLASRRARVHDHAAE